MLAAHCRQCGDVEVSTDRSGCRADLYMDPCVCGGKM